MQIKFYTVTNTYMFSFGMNTQGCMIYQILYNFETDAYDKQVSYRDVGTYLVFDCVQLSSSVLQGNYYYCCCYKTIMKWILFLFHPFLLFFKWPIEGALYSALYLVYKSLLTSFCVFQFKETFLQRACEHWLELFLVTELSFHIKLKDLPFDLMLKTLRSPRSHTFSQPF